MVAMRTQSDEDAFILQVNSCFTPGETIHNASILCRGGRIQAIGGISALRVLEDIPCIDMSAYHAIPGLVDTHIHGSGGFAVMDADENSDMAGMSEILAAHGVTSFVPTVLSAPSEKMLAVVAALAESGFDLCGQQAVMVKRLVARIKHSVVKPVHTINRGKVKISSPVVKSVTLAGARVERE